MKGRVPADRCGDLRTIPGVGKRIETVMQALGIRCVADLRGKDPVRQHMNTIVDYSMLWIVSVRNYYEMSGNLGFLEFIYPKMISLLEYCLEQTNDLGFLYGREGDWIFVDWADLDKEGCLCAEQVLLAYSLRSVLECARALGRDASVYGKHLEKLSKNRDLKKYVL